MVPASFYLTYLFIISRRTLLFLAQYKRSSDASRCFQKSQAPLIFFFMQFSSFCNCPFSSTLSHADFDAVRKAMRTNLKKGELFKFIAVTFRPVKIEMTSTLFSTKFPDFLSFSLDFRLQKCFTMRPSLPSSIGSPKSDSQRMLRK